MLCAFSIYLVIRLNKTGLLLLAILIGFLWLYNIYFEGTGYTTRMLIAAEINICFLILYGILLIPKNGKTTLSQLYN